MYTEREHIAFLYNRLDGERTLTSDRLDRALRDSSADEPEARWQRDVAVSTLSARLRGLRAADNGLCFGRIDHHSGARSYIGRIGLLNDDVLNDNAESDDEPPLTDWRAPAARPFYCATAANPDGVRSRRHFQTRGREILDFHDETLDGPGGWDSDSALLAALNAPREATMRDVVATIQAEQDEIIRLGHTGVVVIEGGPGTGKTAVAMHRVAYLLYTHRERLSRRGVLIIGPHPGFLRYVGAVLPSLGETDVVFATLGELAPGLRVTDEDRPVASQVKGRLTMIEVLWAAVADRQAVPADPIPIELDDVTVLLDQPIAERSRDRARATGLPHNFARATFRAAVIADLTEQAVDLIGAGWLRPRESPELAADLAADVRVELAASPSLTAAIDRLWPRLAPQRLLAELFSSRERLDTAAARLDEAERAALFRVRGDAWTVSDVPLLDELVDLLGGQQKEPDLGERERLEYARGVLDILEAGDEANGDDEVLRAVDVIDPMTLGERHAERDHRDLAERAAADRDWTYGQVVVDEAQELSEMDWRVVMRRCPSRSMTIVGDLAQRQSPAGARAWDSMLHRYVGDRWTFRQLRVNYRTPTEIMAVAADVLAEIDPALVPPTSVRPAGVRPWARRMAPDELVRMVAETIGQESERVGAGTVAVIADHDVAAIVPAVTHTPASAKGLEFDTVIIVEPARILARPDGVSALYVALTRATRRLGVLHTTPLPHPLRGLASSR